MTARHRSRYQERDLAVVDYREYELVTGLRFRGPDPRPFADATIAFLGAAQTFGCFVDQPFPALVGSELETSVANFGWGGAGPRFFAETPELLEAINQCELTVVQVMSARSEDNSVFDSGGQELLRRRTMAHSSAPWMPGAPSWVAIRQVGHRLRESPEGFVADSAPAVPANW